MYVVDEMSDEPIMLIDSVIGLDENGCGIQGDLFQKELLRLDTMGKKRIQVWINSIGGAVVDGYSICNAILKSKTKVDTYCIGMAASIAGVIFQTGRKRVIVDYGILMYHNPYGNPDGSDDAAVQAMKDSLNTIISTKSGMNPEQVKKMMDRETFIDATEAISMGLADEIELSNDFNKKRLAPATVQNKNPSGYWKEAGKILNQIIQSKNPHKMLKVCNKLNLSADASEDSILTEIDKIENKSKGAEKKLSDKEKELADKKDELDAKGKEYDTLKAEHDKTKAEYDALKKKVKDDDDAAMDDKVKNMITGFVKAGKIKNEEPVIKSWSAKAKEDFDGIKAMLEGIPANSKASKFETKTEKQLEDVKKGGVALDMAKISNRLDSKK